MNYSVSKYKKEYTIFCKESNCHVLFFKRKKDAEQRCKELNKQIK
jgi:hypothetical protein